MLPHWQTEEKEAFLQVGNHFRSWSLSENYQHQQSGSCFSAATVFSFPSARQKFTRWLWVVTVLLPSWTVSCPATWLTVHWPVSIPGLENDKLVSTLIIISLSHCEGLQGCGRTRNILAGSRVWCNYNNQRSEQFTTQCRHKKPPATAKWLDAKSPAIFHD